MKAMILAAGEGTRLKPLTDTIPKALIRIHDVTLLEIIIRRLAGAGFSELVINIHHMADKVVEFLHENKNFGLSIELSDERDLLLDTGGAIKKAAALLQDQDPILVHNVDILSNLDIKDLIDYHTSNRAAMTLAVKQRPTTRLLLGDRSGRLCGWECPEKNIRLISRRTCRKLNSWGFSGVYVLSRRILSEMPAEDVFGLMPWVISICGKEKILLRDQPESFWYEAGRIESLILAGSALTFDPSDPVYIFENR